MSENLSAALKRIIGSGYQLTADGLKYLKSLDGESVDELARLAIQRANASPEDRYILDQSYLQSILEERKEKQEPRRYITGKTKRRPLASEYDAQLDVLDDHPAEPAGNIEGFTEYFRSRYKKIEAILRKRLDVRDAVTIGRALKMPLKSKFKVIGIVTRKNARGQRLFIELEDPEESITVLASDDETVRRGLTILEDQVICVDALKYRKDLLIANDFIWPDIPSKTPRRSETPICAAFLSDLQIGSNLFLEELFDRFIRWMNLELGTPDSKRLAARVKYVIIAGDLVDGIGVYPDQIDELKITDIREQYNAAEALLSKLPDYVEVIIIPGNHDAVRKSLPQPPISKEYAEPLYQDRRFHMLGNPSRLLIDGVEALICHGKALDDVLSQTPRLDFQSPLKGMELLLRCRHVAPTYGASTPLAPEKEDRLVIVSTPDIFQMGHIHIYNSKRYKGVTLISSSTWQEQTSFQRRMNLEPTPGIAPIVDLQTHQLIALDFNTLDG